MMRSNQPVPVPLMTPQMQRDYAYYQRTLAERQAAADAWDDKCGFPRRDLAWQATVERERARHRPTWPEIKARFLDQLAAKRYADAIGAQA